MANAFRFVLPEVPVGTSPAGAVRCSALPRSPQRTQHLSRSPLPKSAVRSRLLDAKSRASVVVKASGANPATKPNSIVCADCDGNDVNGQTLITGRKSKKLCRDSAVQCKQCKGTAVNAVDHFGGRFKAGQLCWLCRGKREILCGNCNGAGFIGGFMSTFDD